MTLEDLRIFVGVCERGSLSSLARELARTQSSISQHITRLEVELGVKLFERQARGVVPTAAGRILQDYALQGLDAIQVGLQRVQALQHGESATVTITTGGTTVRHFMRDAVMAFRQRCPHVNLSFLPAGSSRRCLEILRLNQADLAFVTTGQSPRGITERAVARQRLFLLVSRDDPLARRRRLKLKDLAAIRYLGLAGNTTHHQAIEKAAHERGVTLEPEVEFDDFDTARIFVELGLGQAIVPAVQARHFEDGGMVKAVLITDLPALTIGWAFRRWDHLSPMAREFVMTVDRGLAGMRGIAGFERT